MILMACFTSISNIFHTLLSSSRPPHTALTSIPDDILLDIFSRLPADCVLECREVCRHWRTLTSLRCFAEMHYKRATSAISAIHVHCDHFVQFERPVRRHYLVFDEKKRRLKKVDWNSGSVIATLHTCHFLDSSFGGLFLFRELWKDDYITICDTRCIRESRSIINSPKPKGKVCGLYFLPLAREYKILYYCLNHYYLLYDSKTKMWKILNSCAFSPFGYSPPAIVNMAMHWIIDVESVKGHGIDLCTNAIMVYNMDTEAFLGFPHPEINCGNVIHHQRMELFVKDELLCLCDLRYVSDHDGGIDIWILEDYERWFWMKRHQLSVGMFPMIDPRLSSFTSWFKVLIGAVNEDELLINWFSMGFYLVDLTQGTAKELQDPCIRYR